MTDSSDANVHCRGVALWFVGLPGSGKSTVARLVHRSLLDLGVDAVYLEMDARRAAYAASIEEGVYTRQGRDRAYAMFVQEAAELAQAGRCVLMDGTAYRLELRRKARERIPAFVEVHVDCSLETAMAREAGRPKGKVVAEMYAKALERQRTGVTYPELGEVVGVDVPFEIDPGAELRLDSEALSAEACAQRVVDYLRRSTRARDTPMTAKARAEKSASSSP